MSWPTHRASDAQEHQPPNHDNTPLKRAVIFRIFQIIMIFRITMIFHTDNDF